MWARRPSLAWARLAYAAGLLVLVQALLGGLTGSFLPPAVGGARGDRDAVFSCVMVSRS